MLPYTAVTNFKIVLRDIRNCVAVLHRRHYFRNLQLYILTGCLCSDLAVRCTSEKLLSWADMYLWAEVDPKFPSDGSHDTLFPLQRLCSQVLLFIHYD
jgi:hypothetical protein